MKLILIDAGPLRINVIREIRRFTGPRLGFTGIGLQEAKDLIETPNAVIFDGPASSGRLLLKTLTNFGATVEVHGSEIAPSRWLRALADKLDEFAQ